MLPNLLTYTTANHIYSVQHPQQRLIQPTHQMLDIHWLRCFDSPCGLIVAVHFRTISPSVSTIIYGPDSADLRLTEKVRQVVWFEKKLSMKWCSGSHLPDDAGAAAHILVWGVGAGANEAHLDVHGPVVLLGSGTQRADGVRQVGGEGPVHMGLQGVQVQLNQLNGNTSLVAYMF